jgi:chemotaxis receptor (MCP) glutamine deamidase CheD
MVTPPVVDVVALAPLEVFLSPGTLHCAAASSRVTTILGSCVAVCLWDSRQRLGGMNHFVLPRRRGDNAPSQRFGDVAIVTLVEQMLWLGCRIASLRAKLFGGAAVLPFAVGGDPVGYRTCAWRSRRCAITEFRSLRCAAWATRARRATCAK